MADDDVLFVRSGRSADDTARANLETVSYPYSEVKKNWETTIGQFLDLVAVVDARATDTGTLSLETLSLGLVFTATGKLAFIAEASLAASLEMTFRRPKGRSLARASRT